LLQVNIVHDLTERGIGLKVLTGQGAAIDTELPRRFRTVGPLKMRVYRK
jgi:hypothetical protein